jgi:hypothetical protein
MFRSLMSLAFALPTLATVAPAAPVPLPGEKELIAKHWGTTKGNGEFTLSGKQLTIRSDGQPAHGSVHYIDGSTERIPHITRAVAGDFEATVRVVDASAPNNNVGHRDAPETRAGIFLFAGGEAVEVTLSQSGHPDAKREVRLIKWGGPCALRKLLADAESGKSIYLRLTRKDESFTVAYSFDGQKWSEPEDVKPFGFRIPAEVTVGVLVAHNTRQIGASATFDNFTVTKPK